MKQKGFTLIELLVSMGIIAVLSGMAVFNFNQARMRARDVQRKNDLGQLQKVLELYKNDNRAKYPPLIFGVDFQKALTDGGYAKVKFIDPQGDAWHTYSYVPDASLQSYTITACLENTSDTTRKIPVEKCGHAELGVKYIVNNP
ncbi:MAG TPA: type II secretion system protein [Spirochaetia bacterium]|nr:type II secretion system protein [Spirochaetia bacterium]